MEYVTLTQKDEDFRGYLLGTFSQSHVALPVESFGVGSGRERVTFRVMERAQLQKPSWFYIYLRAIRPELLGLTLGHSFVAVVVLLSLFSKHNFSSLMSSPDFSVALILSFFGVVFAHASGCLFNDYRDHMKGVDRRSLSKGSQIIQKGWCRAIDMRRWAFVNAVLAAGVGIYLFWGEWGLFAALLSLSATAILLHSWMIPFWNRLGAGDFWVTFLFGPLIFFSMGLALLSSLHIPLKNYSPALWTDYALISLCLGLMASWTLQVRQFQGIFRLTNEGFRTVIARFSFDQAQKFLVFEVILFSVMQLMVAYFVWPTWRILLTLPLILPCSLYVSSKIFALRSPLSSEMTQLGFKALTLHGVVLFLWVITLWNI